MKKLLIIGVAGLLLTACSESKKADKEAAVVAEQQQLSDGGEYEKDGRYCIYREPQTTTAEDGSLSVNITMTPDFSLPAVENESFGRTYCDNVARVCVTTETDTLLNTQYTKQSLAEWTDETIAGRAILNRLTCRGINGDGVKLEAEISVPHSDEECYVTIKVGRDGSVDISRYMAEEVPDEIAGGQ